MASSAHITNDTTTMSSDALLSSAHISMGNSHFSVEHHRRYYHTIPWITSKDEQYLDGSRSACLVHRRYDYHVYLLRDVGAEWHFKSQGVVSPYPTRMVPFYEVMIW
jgi:hypothetical protein